MLGKLKRSGKYIHNAGRIAKISKRDQMNWEKIENIFTSNKFSPPIVSDLASNLGMEVKVLQDLLDRLCNLGLLIRLTEKRYFSSSTVLDLAKIIETIIDENKLISAGIAHGGYICSIIDAGEGTAAHRASNNSPCVTISLDIKFIGPTKIGDEIKGFTKIQKITKSMVFLICYLESNSKIVASASGVWKKLKKNITNFGPGG